MPTARHGLLVGAAACALVAAAVAWVPARAQDAASLGAWLMTPAERERVQQQRRAATGEAPANSEAPAADGEAPAPSAWHFQGLSRLANGPASAWVNGELVQAGQTLAGGARLEAIEADAIWVRWKGRRHRLRPGEVLNSEHEISDTVPTALSKNATPPAVARRPAQR